MGAVGRLCVGAAIALAALIAFPSPVSGQGASRDPLRCTPYWLVWDNGLNRSLDVEALSALRARITGQGLTEICPRLLGEIDRQLARAQEAARGSSPPVDPREPVSAEETAFNRVRERNNTCEGWEAYIEVFGATGTFGRRAAQERDRLCARAALAVTVLDARSTPVSTRAPVVRNPAGLPDFALFRECDGCPEMVVIPAGTFTMGSPASEPGRRSDEGPQVGVRVPRFAISRFETTWDEWDACVNAGVCQQREDSGFGRGRRPVINVDWQTDTRAFIRFVNSQASGYRLPSEAEWEYAARAGTTGRFSNNGAEAQLCQIANHADWLVSYSWRNTACSDGVGEQTAPVGRYAANPFGLYDMHGNVWEWVEDCYRDNLSGQTAAANTTGDCSLRVRRGGSWSYGPVNLRSAYRSWSYPSGRFYYWGFRLARTL